MKEGDVRIERHNGNECEGLGCPDADPYGVADSVLRY